MRVEEAFVGARGFDSVGFSGGGTEKQANAMKASGMDFFVGYLGAVTSKRLGDVLAAGLAFMPVTFAGEYKDGAADELAQLKALAIPIGTTVWLDLEGLDAWNTPAAVLVSTLEKWSAPIVGAGYVAGIYVGAPQPLTGSQLYALKGFTRYWLGIGRCVDKTGDDAYPRCGWCMRQDWHGQPKGMFWKDTGVFIDSNAIQRDHFGRLPTWVRA